MPASGVSDNIYYLGRPSVLRLLRTLRLPLFLSESGLTLGPQLLISHSPFFELGLALSLATGEPDKSEHHQDRPGYDQGRGREGIEGVSDHITWAGGGPAIRASHQRERLFQRGAPFGSGHRAQVRAEALVPLLSIVRRAALIDLATGA